MKGKKRESVRVLKFVLFSISAGVIEIAAFALLDSVIKLPYWPSYLIALILSVVWNFTLNRKFTFQSANNVPIAMVKVAIFYAIFTPATTILGNHLAENVGVNDYLVTIMNMAINFVTEYIYDRFIVFGKSIDTNKRALEKMEEEK